MVFSYKARTKEGKIRKGTIEAVSRKGALDLLEKYGLYVTSLKVMGREKIWEKKISWRKISLKDIVIFTRQMAIMLKAAISPVEALRAQVIQIENNDFREKVLRMGEMIERGKTLSQSFAMFPEIFDPFSISILKSGEVSGRMAESLDYLATHLEKKYKLGQKITNAFTYPIFVIFVFIGVSLLVSFFIIPNLTQLLENFQGELPWSTKIIISGSDFIRKGGWLILVGFLIIFLLLFLTIKKSPGFKKIYDREILKVPFFGDLTKKIYLSRFSENFSVLLSAGLPITQALVITQEIIGNITYKEILKETQEEVLRGENISSVFTNYPQQIPPFVTQLIATGEKTGTLDQILMEIVKFYEDEVERATANLSAIIEPALLLFLGLGVGILAIAIFIPLFKIGLGSTEGF